MRLVWTFFAGVSFAALLLLASVPFVGGSALIARLMRGDVWTVLSGQSYFAARQQDGRLLARAVSVAFAPYSFVADGKPRKLLSRIEVSTGDLAEDADGRVRLDAWPFERASDLHRPALYTIVVPGRGARLSDDGMVIVERAGGRRVYYSVADGRWLFDADTPIVVVAGEGRPRRFAALAAAEETIAPGAVAVLTYASSLTPLRRLVVTADDARRARFLRGALAMTRLAPIMDENARRAVEIRFPAATIRLPVSDAGLDLGRAQVPAGLHMVEMTPWRAGEVSPAGGGVTPSPGTSGALPPRSTRDRGH